MTLSTSSHIPSGARLNQFWGQMRSVKTLLDRSEVPSHDDMEQFVLQLRHILGTGILTYPPVLGRLGIGEQTSYRQKKALLGLEDTAAAAPMSKQELDFMQYMLNKAGEARKYNWQWRITEEAKVRQAEGWYPFFVTLTVDPKKCMGKPVTLMGRTVTYDSPRQLWEKGREFRLYIRKLATAAARSMGHLPPHKQKIKHGKVVIPYRPESDYVRYAAVLEHGKTNEHHHMHLMVWLRDIPPNWKQDPNQGRLPQYRSERECKHMRFYWPWCIADQKPALYFRSKGDIWSQLGHVTPIDEKGKPIKINPVEAVGNYVTKYMQKGHKAWKHKMKCTRNLGMDRLNQLIKSLPMQVLTPLSWKPEKYSTHHTVTLIHSVPPALIRLAAKRRILEIQWEEKSAALKDLMKTNYGVYIEMLSSVRDGARPERMHSGEFYDWVQQFLPDQNGYCEKTLLAAHEEFSYDFPRSRHSVMPVIIPGNQIGFTSSI
jgi:hypothetical protein